MKEKLLYNQKYIVNLKCEFKNKIEGLYRNLRKNNWFWVYFFYFWGNVWVFIFLRIFCVFILQSLVPSI